jgi:hypothetical protein
MRRFAAACGVGALVLGLAACAWAGRHEEFTRKAADGPKMQVLAATFFGSDGIEEFVAAEGTAGGGVVAFGNAWGPRFADAPRPEVLGRGRHAGLQPYATGKGGRALRPEDPDVAGMIVIYAPGLKSIVKVTRFDWGVASISTGAVSRDGKALLVAGRCTESFRALARAAGLAKSQPAPAPDSRRRRGEPAVGPYAYDGVSCTGDVYVMRLAPTTNRIEWVWVLEGHQTPPARLWQDDRGAVYFEVHGVTRIAADGAVLTKLTQKGSGGQVGLRAVDPADGSFFIGGDRNSSTGREPWRQPFLYKFDPTGTKVWTMWEWPSRNLRDGQGSDDGLVSDSSVRALAVAPGGDLLIGGWSDGGNSIFTRQPTAIEKPVPKSAFGMSGWGMRGANSLGYLMRADPKGLDIKTWTLWVSYVPDNFQDPKYRGAPNFANVQDLRVLEDGSVAFQGSAATGFIQTPNAFYKDPGDGRKYGGETVAVFSADLAALLFSSYLPGCENVAIGPARGGLVIASRSRGDDGQAPPTPSPTVAALQREKRGDYDGHLVLLALPSGRRR